MPARPVAIAEADITITLPYGSDVSALVAEFTTGENVSRVAVNQKAQESGKTTNNFSSPVKYYVTMSTGATRVYTVTVNFTPNPVSLYEDFESYNPGDFPERNFSIFDSYEGLAVEKDNENQVFALTSDQAPVTRMVFTKDLKQQLLGGVKQLSLRVKANNVFSGAFYLSTSANNAGNIVHIWAVRCDIKNNQYTISVGKGSNINDVTLVGNLTADGYITLNLLVDAPQKRYQLSAADETGAQIASGWQAWDSSAFDLNALSQTMFHMNATINQNASVFVDDISLIDFGQKAVLQSQKVLYDAPVLVRLLGEVQGKDPANIKLRTSSGSAVEATNTFDAASGILTIQPAAPLSYPASYVVDFSSYDGRYGAFGGSGHRLCAAFGGYGL